MNGFGKWAAAAAAIVVVMGAIGGWLVYTVETRAMANYNGEKIDNVEQDVDQQYTEIKQQLIQILDHVRPWTDFGP